MELKDVLVQVRAVRQFRPEPPDPGAIRALVEAALSAPSASNVQGWRFLLVDDVQLMRRLVDLGASTVMLNAPIGLLVLYDNRTSNSAYRDDLQSACAGIQNLILRAQEFGLGCCWICRLPRRSRLKRLLKIPWCYDPVAYVALGYPQTDGQPPRPKRLKFAPEQVMARNAFTFTDVPTGWWLHVKWAIQLRRRRLIRWYYFAGPGWLRHRLASWL